MHPKAGGPCQESEIVFHILNNGGVQNEVNLLDNRMKNTE
jgi:hypothetical protein